VSGGALKIVSGADLIELSQLRQRRGGLVQAQQHAGAQPPRLIALWRRQIGEQRAVQAGERCVEVTSEDQRLRFAQTLKTDELGLPSSR
jgi:hypothetical protein